MKNLLLLFSFSLAMFSCQKTNLIGEQQEALQPIENQSASDRSCTLEVTPLTGSGSAWFATIYGNNTVVARICGTSYNNPNYTKVAWNEVFSVPGGTAYKQYRIVEENLNTTFQMKSDAGCFNLSCFGGGSYPFYAGCASNDCTVGIKVVSSTNPTGWKAEIHRIDDSCNDVLVAEIGGSTSGSDLFIPIGGTLPVGLDGFQQVSIKQITGNVKYTLTAPSTVWAPISPATFTVTAGATASRRVGCSN